MIIFDRQASTTRLNSRLYLCNFGAANDIIQLEI